MDSLERRVGRNDAEFGGKGGEVVGLYMARRENGMVMSVMKRDGCRVEVRRVI